MNKSVLFFSAIAVALISLCVLFMLHIIPSGQLWDNYNVLYVDIEADVQTVRNTLHEEAIEGVLYPDHNNFPIPSMLAPVQYHRFSTGFSYEELQTSFFFDKEKNYHLYYIPHEYLQNAKTALKDFPYMWGIDAQSTIPAIPFITVLLLTIFLLIHCKNKLYFLCIQIPLILYCIAAPFYHIAAAVCLLSLAVFSVQKYWNRQHFLPTLLRNIFFIVSVGALIASSFLLGFRGFVLLFMTMLLTASFLYLTFYIKQSRYTTSIFKPVLIHTARTINTKKIISRTFMLVCVCAIAFLTIFSLLNMQPQKKNTEKALQFPAPSGYTVTGDFSSESYIQTVTEDIQDRLPDLTDFVSTAWHFETYPYKKLDSNETNIVFPGERVEKIEYTQNGYSLEEKTELVALFDDAYIQRIISSALLSPNAGAEKLLTSQDGFSRVTYTETGAFTAPQGATIFLVLLCAYSIYILIALHIKRQ